MQLSDAPVSSLYHPSMSDRLAKLTKLLALDERDTFTLYALAQEHAKLGDHAQAVSFFDRCLAVDPHYHYAYFHKARSLLAAGDRAAALDTARTGLEQAEAAGDPKAINELTSLAIELRGPA